MRAPRGAFVGAFAGAFAGALAWMSAPAAPAAPLSPPAESSLEEREGVTPAPGARAALVGFNLLAGLSFYAPAAVSLLDSSSPRVNVGAYLLTAGGSFLVPYLGTSKRDVSWATADLSSSLSLRGALHGVQLAALLDTSEDAAVALAGLLSMAEGVGGYQYAKRARLSAGEAHTLVVSSDLGMLAGLFGALVASDGRVRVVPVAAFSLTGALAGFGAGELYRRRRARTWGDAEVVRLSALLGLMSSAPISASLSVDSPRAFGLCGLATLAAGAAVGDLLTRGAALSLSDALIMDASAVGGAFLGAGAMYVVNPELRSSTPYLWSALVGAAAGYALSYLSATRWERADVGFEGAEEGAEEGAGQGAGGVSLGPWLAPLPRAGGGVDVARGLGLSGSL